MFKVKFSSEVCRALMMTTNNRKRKRKIEASALVCLLPAIALIVMKSNKKIKHFSTFYKFNFQCFVHHSTEDDRRFCRTCLSNLKLNIIVILLKFIEP